MRLRNPFSITHTTAGAIPFYRTDDPAEFFWSQTLDRFERNGCLGQIFGPHGSGKTTFLEQFLPHLHASGYQTYRISLHDHRRTLPRAYRDDLFHAGRTETSGAARIMIVDGYEQLDVFSRLILRYYRFRCDFGLLFTVHRRRPLTPVLLRTSPDSRILERILEHIRDACAARERLREHDRSFLEHFFRHRTRPEHLRAMLEKHHGNIRLVLLDLYDLWERETAPSHR